MSRFITDKLKSLFKSTPVVNATAEAMKPSVVAAAATAQKLMAQAALKPHTPLIKFRKDAPTSATSGTKTSSHPSQRVQASAPGGRGPGNVALPLIEDWQLPQRYRRRPLDQEEIDYINRGGPA